VPEDPVEREVVSMAVEQNDAGAMITRCSRDFQNARVEISGASSRDQASLRKQSGLCQTWPRRIRADRRTGIENGAKALAMNRENDSSRNLLLSLVYTSSCVFARASSSTDSLQRGRQQLSKTLFASLQSLPGTFPY